MVRHRERLDALGVAAFAQDVVVEGVAPDAAWKDREREEWLSIFLIFSNIFKIL